MVWNLPIFWTKQFNNSSIPKKLPLFPFFEVAVNTKLHNPYNFFKINIKIMAQWMPVKTVTRAWISRKPEASNFLMSTPYGGWNSILNASYIWGRYVKEFADLNGFKTLELIEDATQFKFEEGILNHAPVFIYGAGHGNPYVFTGFAGSWLLELEQNTSITYNKIIYLMSCSTAKLLGKEISKYATCYVGYEEDFAIIEQLGALFNPVEPRYYRIHWSWMDHVNLIVTGILGGRTVSEAVAKSVERTQAWINFWSEMVSPLNDIPLALEADLEALRIYGDSSIKISAPPSKHVRAVYACYGDTLISTCQYDDCDFRGQTVKVYDENLNFLGETTFTQYKDGINIAEYPVKQNVLLFMAEDDLHPATWGKAMPDTEGL
jgi:hypothetical protein